MARSDSLPREHRKGGRRLRSLRKATLLLGVCVVAGCANSGDRGPAEENRVEAGGRPSGPQGIYKVGNPYQIKGVWYYPRVDYDYDEVGVASWYGPGFDGQPTANGETYDMNDMTAAHRTLPMPSIVEVTNLENGRTVHLRVNDRGPFAKERIIDVSRRAAQLLGFHTAGTTPVRVRIVADESRALAQAMTQGGSVPPVLVSGEPATIGQIPQPPVVAPTLASTAVAPPPPPPSAPIATEEPPPELAAADTIVAGDVAPPAIAVEDLAMPASALDDMPPPREIPKQTGSVIRQPPASKTVASAKPAQTVAAPAIKVAAATPATRGAAAVHPGGPTFIQAGAFSDPVNARRARDRLVGLGPVQIDTRRVGERDMFRVRIGPFASIEAGERARLAAIRAGFADSRVVSD